MLNNQRDLRLTIQMFNVMFIKLLDIQLQLFVTDGWMDTSLLRMASSLIKQAYLGYKSKFKFCQTNNIITIHK